MTPKKYTVRDYQEDIKERVRLRMRAGVKRILITAPTGSGKTVLTADMLHTSASRGFPSVFNVHRRELIRQSTRTFSDLGVRHGLIAAGAIFDPNHTVHVASIQTLANRIKSYTKKPRFIVWDECHHLAAGSWKKIYEAFPNAFHIGLTATPERHDGKGLGKFFEEMIEGPSVEWLIEQGYLCPYKLFAPNGVQVEGKAIVGDVLSEYFKLSNGKQAIAFCHSIEASEDLVRKFLDAGISARHVDGETDRDVRDISIQMFERKEIRLLSNVDLFGEGFDVPGIDTVIDAAPTDSLSRWLQRCGRALRPVYAPGYDLSTREGRVAAIAASEKPFATIIDHAGNVVRLGLPDDPRCWRLEGRAARLAAEKNTGPGVRVCPKCYSASFSTILKCRTCGFDFPVVPRHVETVDGELVEFQKAEARKQLWAENRSAESVEELAAIAKRRGYKHPYRWAKRYHDERQALRLKKGRS